MIQAPSVTLVKTFLGFVKDGIWAGKYIYIMDYITHVGEHQFVGSLTT
ncbi:MAG: hypothetical protein CM15mV45_390 [uncultured marine virus]|nr:MAG: hypothetical protein CM15mV45_390 [uncultured marine virus]